MSKQKAEKCEFCLVSTRAWIEVDEIVVCVNCVKQLVSEIPCTHCEGGTGAFARGGGVGSHDVFCKDCIENTDRDLADVSDPETDHGKRMAPLLDKFKQDAAAAAKKQKKSKK